MGADLHLMIDYDMASKSLEWGARLSTQRRDVTPFRNAERVASLFTTAISPTRDYRLFTALAGVRGNNKERPLIAPRGFPDVSSSNAFNEFHLCVVDDAETTLSPRDIRHSDAQDLIRRGVARLAIAPGRPVPWMTDPEFHTPSWLTYREVLAALKHAGCVRSELDIEFRIVLTSMDMLDQEYGIDHTRLVFWFDN